MKSIIKGTLAVVGLAALASAPADAFENASSQQKAGIFLGASAGVPPPGIYMFDQVFTYQSNVAGPATAQVGNKNGVQNATAIVGFLFVPGWTFLGATYDAILAQPVGMTSFGQPSSLRSAPLTNFPLDMYSGAHNTYFAPIELSWNFKNGFFIKAGLGIFAPTGTVQGATGVAILGQCQTAVGCNGYANYGQKYWTWQPEVIFSYLGGGWNLSAALYGEINTANSQDNYTNGNIFHADFTATKTFGKWTVGPVAYYVAQVSDDKCPVGVCTALHPGVPLGGGVFLPGSGGIVGNTQRYQVWAAGGLVEYNFGPASLTVWATQELSAKASGVPVPAGVLGPGPVDISQITKGATVFATLSYRIWAPEEPAKAPMIHK